MAFGLERAVEMSPGNKSTWKNRKKLAPDKGATNKPFL
jgi:hypothetical protein